MNKIFPFISAADNSDQFLEIIEAAADAPSIDLKKCDGIAYSGGSIRQYWSSYPMVVDLTGMDQAGQIPLLYNHTNDPDYRLGVVTATIANNALHVSGGISAKTEKAQNIIDQGKDFNWQLSIGAEPTSIERVEAGEKVTVNNQEFSGPISVVRKSLLKEVSVVAVGADAQTHLNIAAKFQTNQNTQNPSQKPIKGAQQMDNETLQFIIAAYGLAANTTADQALAHIQAIGVTEADVKAKMAEQKEPKEPKDPKQNIQASAQSQTLSPEILTIRAGAAAELDRINKINALYPGEHQAIKAAAIADGSSIEAAELLMAKAVLAQRPQAPGIMVGKPQNMTVKVLEAAALMSTGFSQSALEKKFDAQTLELAYGHSSPSMKGLIQAALSIEGKSAPAYNASPEEWIKASFSTNNVSVILSNIANKVLESPFESDADISAIMTVCRERSLNDLKTHTMTRLFTDKKLPKVGDAGLELDSLQESSNTLKAETRGKLIGITRTMIINDDLNAFTELPEKISMDAIDQFCDDFVYLIETTMGDNFFKTENGNINSETLQPSIEAYEKLKILFAAFTDGIDRPDGTTKKIGARPAYILTGADLNPAARTMFDSLKLLVTDRNSTATKTKLVGDSNTFAGQYKPVEVTRLKSAVWYGFADPRRIPAINVGFLNGKRRPVVEEVTQSMDPRQLGRWWRIIWDYGFGAGDYQGAAKFK